MNASKQLTVEQSKGQRGDAHVSGDISDAVMNNPGALARLQEGITYDARLQAMVHYQSLPEPVKRRVRALKKLQFRTLEVEGEFYRELHELEMRYSSRYADQLQRRHRIVTGDAEPTNEEADWPEDTEAEMELAGLAREKSAKAAAPGDSATADPGVPNFWLTALKNVELIGQMIQEHDEPILRHLTDIRAGLFNSEQAGFTLEFHFSANEYFTNSVLTKHYYMRMAPDRLQPWSYDGPEIVRCQGCDIQWRKGKNVTVKIVKKVQRHKGNGQKRTITKTVETDSFFNFFNPPTQAIGDLNEDDSEDEEIENLLQSDFEIGHFIRERIVPRAVLYFTGEGLDDEDEFDEDEEEEEEDVDDEINEDEVEEYTAQQQ